MRNRCHIHNLYWFTASGAPPVPPCDDMSVTLIPDNNVLTEINYGLLYNWYAATDARNIANTGWSVPTNLDFNTLRTYLTNNGYGYEGSGNDIAKSVSFTSGWNSSGTPGTPGNDQSSNNTANFNIKPAPNRSTSGMFESTGNTAAFHTYNIFSVDFNYRIFVNYNTAFLYEGFIAFSDKFWGMSLRLVKNATTLSNGETGTYVGNDGKIYRTICIGTQEWLADNLAETKYRDNTWIPGYDGGIYTPISNAAWAALTTGALCAYNDDENNV